MEFKLNASSFTTHIPTQVKTLTPTQEKKTNGLSDHTQPETLVLQNPHRQKTNKQTVTDRHNNGRQKNSQSNTNPKSTPHTLRIGLTQKHMDGHRKRNTRISASK